MDHDRNHALALSISQETRGRAVGRDVQDEAADVRAESQKHVSLLLSVVVTRSFA